MKTSNIYGYQDSNREKFYRLLQDIWPAIYNLINSFVFGIVKFFRFLISGLWPGK